MSHCGSAMYEDEGQGEVGTKETETTGSAPYDVIFRISALLDRRIQ